MEKSIPLHYGQYYHIYNRGINRENVFFEARNYRHFLKGYVKYVLPIADTYAYCLLKNHLHFLVRIKTEAELQRLVEKGDMPKIPKPSTQFGHLFNSYAKSINKTYKRTGSLFQKRFGRKWVDSDRYFSYLVIYIHRNPQRHRLVKDYKTYPYSSYQAIRYQRASRVETEQVLAWFDNEAEFDRLHQVWKGESEIQHLIGDDFD